jgi:hypothetical protein
MECFWRRGGDSNPRYRFKSVRRFSKPLLSTTQPPLREVGRISCDLNTNSGFEMKLEGGLQSAQATRYRSWFGAHSAGCAHSDTQRKLAPCCVVRDPKIGGRASVGAGHSLPLVVRSAQRRCAHSDTQRKLAPCCVVRDPKIGGRASARAGL